MLLDNKVAIITGSSRGIGRGIAFQFAKNGAQTVLVARNQELLNKVQDEIASAGYKCPHIVVADLKNDESIQSVVQETLDKYQLIDILVNNAGITRDTLMVRMSEDEWDAVLDSNLKSVFLMTRAVSKTMMRQRRGRIINVSSVIGLVGNSGQANYAASKAGILGFTKSVAKELASRNILVNAIAPGFIETEMTGQLPEAVQEQIMKSIPMKKMGSVEDVANVALYLASDLSSYVTGQTIAVDGGMVMF